MNSKHILQSKTFWTYVLVLIIAAFKHFGIDGDGATLDEGTVTMLLGALGIVLRIVTTQPVHLS